MNSANCLRYIISEPEQAESFTQEYLSISAPSAVQTLQAFYAALLDALANEPQLERQLRLALTLTSLRSRDSKIPYKLVGLLLEYGFISVEAAIRSANSHSAESFKSTAIISLAPYLNAAEAIEAYLVASRIGSDYFRLIAQAHLVKRLPEEQRLTYSRDLLAETPDINTQQGWATLHLALVDILPFAERAQLVESIFFALFSYRTTYEFRGAYLLKIIPYMSYLLDEQQQRWLTQLADLLQVTALWRGTLKERQSFTAYIAGVFIGIDIEANSAISSLEPLGECLPYLIDANRPQLLDHLYTRLQSFEDVRKRAIGLASLAHHLSEDDPLYQAMVDEAWAAAQAVEFEDRRAYTMSYIAARMKGKQREGFIQLALESFPENPVSLDIDQAIIELAPVLSLDDTLSMLAKRVAYTINDNIYSLVASIIYDPSQIVRIDAATLDELIAWWDGQARMTEILSLAYILDVFPLAEQEKIVTQLLTQTVKLDSPRSQAYSYRHLLPYLAGKKRTQVIEQWQNAVKRLNSENESLSVSVTFGRVEELASLLTVQAETEERSSTINELVLALHYFHQEMQGGDQSKMYLTNYVNGYLRPALPTLTNSEADSMLAQMEELSFRPYEQSLLTALITPYLSPALREQKLSEQVEALRLLFDPSEPALPAYAMYAHIYQFALLLPSMENALVDDVQARLSSWIEQLPPHFQTHLWSVWVMATADDKSARLIYLQHALTSLELIGNSSDSWKTLRDMPALLPDLSEAENLLLCQTLLRYSTKMRRLQLLRLLPIWHDRFVACGLNTAVSHTISHITQLFP